MLSRFFAKMAYATANEEVKRMLVRLYAGEIIAEKITEDNVPPKLKARVHQYLVDFGYFEE